MCQHPIKHPHKWPSAGRKKVRSIRERGIISSLKMANSISSISIEKDLVAQSPVTASQAQNAV